MFVGLVDVEYVCGRLLLSIGPEQGLCSEKILDIMST